MQEGISELKVVKHDKGRIQVKGSKMYFVFYLKHLTFYT